MVDSTQIAIIRTRPGPDSAEIHVQSGQKIGKLPCLIYNLSVGDNSVNKIEKLSCDQLV